MRLHLLHKLGLTAAVFGMACAALAQSSTLRIDVGSAYSQAAIYRLVDSQARSYTQVAATLSERARADWRRTRQVGGGVQFSLPMRAVLTANGRALSASIVKPSATNALTLAFDTSGPYVFPADYQTLLQNVFAQAAPTINAIFGPPSSSGVVYVRNYDATISDRDAVAGGIYLANNGSGQAEIRFPVYNSDGSAAVNFIHTLLLAYLGSDSYSYDAFEEGLVRAATMKICRTPGALPAMPDTSDPEATLDATYDAGEFYDWYNQRALGGPQFIAPNLHDLALPLGGSVGGIFLLRFQMAGSAWQKLLVEYPGFISALNSALYGNPSLGSDVPGLITSAQSAMDSLAGGPNSTVEGLSFAEWYRRQFVLDTTLTVGQKVLVQPTPITSGLSGNDFGVFNIVANYFSTDASDNETLRSAICFPIFYDNSFFRLFPSDQDNQIDIAAAYGSVAPNFPDFSIGPYRATVDIPIQDQIARVYLPAGSIATPTSANVSDFYGTVEGAPLTGGDTLEVDLSFPGSSTIVIPVTNGAFGALIGTSPYLAGQTLTVSVVLNHQGSPTTLMTRTVDKGPGPLALDLRVGGDGSYTLTNLPAGISTFGLPVDPYASDASNVLGLTPDQMLLARFNQTFNRYDLYPAMESPTIGHGYFLRLDSPIAALQIPGRSIPNIPSGVALKPGWNMIASPLPESVATTDISVIRSIAEPSPYATSAGVDIGLNFFTFQAGPPDAASGVPETGSWVQATTFDPGQSYFVQVFAPEGVTLLFYPSSVAAPFAATTSTPDGWSMKLDLQGPGRTVSAHIGATSKATSTFNSKYDCPMPPATGGLQICSLNPQRLYRDVRELQSGHTYTIQLEGLIPGNRYTLATSMDWGKVDRLSLTDGRTSWTRRPSDPPYAFVASSATKILSIGVRRRGD